MNKIEQIIPYTNVEENGKYGIVDADNVIVVPCEFELIINTIDEESGLDFWDDFGFVDIYDNGKYGFFTNNGTFVKPLCDEFTVEPDGNEIHVKVDDKYGILAYPDYKIRLVSYSETVFPEAEDESLNDF